MNLRFQSQIVLLALVCTFSIGMYAQGPEYNNVAIDKQPLQIYAASVRKRIEGGSLNPAAAFRIEMELALDSSGKFDRSKSRGIKSNGDPELAAVAKDGVFAIGESGWFGYVHRLPEQPSRFSIVVEQNDKIFSATLKCDSESENRAKSTASSLSLLVDAAAHHAGDSSKADGMLLLKSTRVFSEGASYFITITLPANSPARDILLQGLIPRSTK